MQVLQPCPSMITFHVLQVWQHTIEFFFLCFQLKPVSTTAVPAAATGSLSSVATDPEPPLLVPQCSSSSLDSAGNVDGEEEMLGWS